MRIGAGLSTSDDAGRAAVEAAGDALTSIGSGPTSLAVVFASPHHAATAERLIADVRAVAAPEHLIGCVGQAVVGGGREIEDSPAVAVWLAQLPEPAETFHMEFVRTSSGGAFGGYRLQDGAPYLLLADPFTFPLDLLLHHVNEALPGTTVIGGMASGGQQPGDTRLFVDDSVVAGGAVGARLPGAHIRPLVAQGCRPIGPVYTVTRADGNVVHELGGRPPLERLEEIVGRVPNDERVLITAGVHVGRVIDEHEPVPGRGDYLVRGVMGIDGSSGAMAVGDHIEVGETMRFHVRDATTADEDLRDLLDLERRTLGGNRVVGALLFTCNGRGSRLFGVPDHDASLLAELLDAPPVAGFFCAGEIGPVGGRNFLHGFTASAALFVDA